MLFDRQNRYQCVCCCPPPPPTLDNMARQWWTRTRSPTNCHTCGTAFSPPLNWRGGATTSRFPLLSQSTRWQQCSEEDGRRCCRNCQQVSELFATQHIVLLLDDATWQSTPAEYCHFWMTRYKPCNSHIYCLTSGQATVNFKLPTSTVSLKKRQVE